MNDKERASWLKEKIRLSLKTVEQNPLWKYLLRQFSVTTEDVAEMYFRYEYDVYSFGNEIYNPLEIRFVLYLLSIKEGSWHLKKQSVVDSWLKTIWPCNIVDIGFGVPQKYHINRSSQKIEGSITLVEYNQNALNFAKEILTFKKFMPANIFLINGGFFDTPVRSKLLNTPNTWIFLDSLEHFDNPLSILGECVSVSQKKSNYIFSLPLGEQVPVHTHSWKDEHEALNWLSGQGFTIKDYFSLQPNPEIEWFVHSLHNFSTMKEMLIFASQ